MHPPTQQMQQMQPSQRMQQQQVQMQPPLQQQQMQQQMQQPMQMPMSQQQMPQPTPAMGQPSGSSNDGATSKSRCQKVCASTSSIFASPMMWQKL